LVTPTAIQHVPCQYASMTSQPMVNIYQPSNNPFEEVIGSKVGTDLGQLTQGRGGVGYASNDCRRPKMTSKKAFVYIPRWLRNLCKSGWNINLWLYRNFDEGSLLQPFKNAQTLSLFFIRECRTNVHCRAWFKVLKPFFLYYIKLAWKWVVLCRNIFWVIMIDTENAIWCYMYGVPTA